MKRDDIPVLNQLIESLGATASNLEESYNKKDSESFNKSKKFMLQIQQKISEVIEILLWKN